ncbi:MAG: outer membrane beta-barrel protein [Candidatus Tectimicrobiota bacterium]
MPTLPGSLEAPPGPLETQPATQEPLLAPVPQQFNWLQREAPSNALLEALLSVQSPGGLTLSTSLTEEASDNFAHSRTDTRSAARTGVTLGTIYRLNDERLFVSLLNSVRAFYETPTDRSQIGYANLSLNAGYQLAPFSFGLSDRFTRDDSGQSSSLTVPDTTAPLLRPGQTFLRNSVSPQVRYEISPRVTTALRYTNTVVIDESDSTGDYISHTVSPTVAYQLSRNLAGSTSYSFTRSDSAGAGASIGSSHRLTTNLGYRYDIDARTSASVTTFATGVDRSSSSGGQNSLTYGGSIGVRRLLFSTVSILGSIGPSVVQRQGESARVRAVWNVSLDGPIPIFATPTLTLTLVTRQNVQDTVGEVNDVGLVLRQIADARLTYTPAASFNAALFATYTRNELLEGANASGATRGRIDNFWSTGLRASYALTRIISLTGIYRYQRRDSNNSINDYDENRLTVALTGAFPIF